MNDKDPSIPISKVELAMYQTFRQTVHNRAVAVFDAISDATDEIEWDSSCLDLVEVGTYDVTVKGSMTWRYGGNESYSYSFPTKLLYSDLELSRFISSCNSEQE